MPELDEPTLPVAAARPTRRRLPLFWLEWAILIAVITLYSRAALLDFDPHQLAQTAEQNESATLPILAEIGLWRYGEIPLWNPYMLTGFPLAGDPVSHFWNPVATLPVLLWGGVNGMKVSLYLSLLVAGFGQWFMAHVFGIRGLLRLWAGLLFALSGGLALLLWLGWYELLVGAAWFPWCFGLLWVALRRRDRRSLVLTALAVAMVITAGGGYYPLYLAVCLAVLTVAALARARRGSRRAVVGRALAVAALAAGLSAATLLPLADGLRYTARDAPPDTLQITSQPLLYALFNYVVADHTWFKADVLNKGVGWGWFYIGALPLLALALAPWVFARFRWRRGDVLTLLALLLVLLLWQASRYPPVSLLYQWLPFLTTFRFPNRLLIVATIPLVTLAALTLQAALVAARRWARARRTPAAARWLLVMLPAALLLGGSLADVYRTNQPFATNPHPRNAVARGALTWLRREDPSLYYTNIGGTAIYWDWAPYAYELEMPMLNFRYNRRVRAMDAQYKPTSPFNAQPKYVLAAADHTPAEPATLLTSFNGVNLWRRDDALPFAFAADPDGPITWQTVAGQPARLDGPNRVIVTADVNAAGRRLVVLVSDYPGWQLWVDGERAAVEPLNGYLGAALRPGAHTYTFVFRPTSAYVGMGVSGLALVLCLALPARRGLRGIRREEERDTEEEDEGLRVPPLPSVFLRVPLLFPRAMRGKMAADPAAWRHTS